MELETIRERGRLLGLNRFIVEGPKKGLIQAIQHAEGKASCFRGDERFSCATRDCEWRRECLKLTAAWRR